MSKREKNAKFYAKSTRKVLRLFRVRFRVDSAVMTQWQRSYKLSLNRGQSLLEVIIAMAIFVLIASALASMAVGSFAALEQGGEQTEAEGLAQEGIEAVRAIRDRAWNEVRFTTSTVATSALGWGFGAEGSTQTIGQYTRTISFENVCRNSSSDIAACPASSTDPHVRKVTSAVSWTTAVGAVNIVERVGLFANWDSRDWKQTNWAGGTGQTIWSDITKYLSDDGRVNATGTPGQVTLAAGAGGNWVRSGGAEFVDTSDTDFNAGTFTSTTVTGTGDEASVVLATNTLWALHQDSGVVTNLDLDAVRGASSDRIWAVGNNGIILEYNGTSWVSTSSPTSNLLHGLYVSTSTEAWASGASGVILKYDGASWTLHTDTGNESWNSIYMVSSTEGWVVGDQGKIFFYNGTAWSSTSSPVSGGVKLNSIFMVSSTDGWIVGSAGNILRYNGTIWSVHTDTGNHTWNAVYMVSATDGWAVGGSGAIRRFNGSTWSSVTSPTNNDITDVFMVSATDGWAVAAQGQILHYDGASWSVHTDLGNQGWNSVYMVNSTEGWAVGSSGVIAIYGALYTSGTFLSRIFDGGSSTTTWTGLAWTQTLPSGSSITVATRSGNTPTPDGTWSSFSAELSNNVDSEITSPAGRYFQYRLTMTRGTNPLQTPSFHDITIVYNAATTENLNDLSAVSSTDIWAVGNGGKIIHYDGNNWSQFTDTGSETWNSVSMVSANDGWTVGSAGAIRQYNGSTWSAVTSPTTKGLQSVAMVSSTEGWAVGDTGTIIQYNGTSWSTVSSPTNSALNDVFVVNATDVWAVGASGKILRYTGASWAVHTDVGNNVLESIYIVSSSDGWAVGAAGEIWRYNGTTWSLFVDTGAETWLSVWMVSANDGWLVGQNGDIRHFDGTSWSAVSSPTNQHLDAVMMITESDGWAVGNRGVILHFSREALYLTSGSLVSSQFDMGDPSPAQVLEWDETIPSGCSACTIRLQLRVAPDSGGSPGTFTSYFGAGGVGTYFTTSTGSLIPDTFNWNQWMQYRAELASDGQQTPALLEVRVNYK